MSSILVEDFAEICRKELREEEELNQAEIDSIVTPEFVANMMSEVWRAQELSLFHAVRRFKKEKK